MLLAFMELSGEEVESKRLMGQMIRNYISSLTFIEYKGVPLWGMNQKNDVSQFVL